MASFKPTISFFGATGDCAGYCLAAALHAGHTCVALARTPEKLQASMTAKGVSTDELSRLSIVQGDVRDAQAVQKALTVGNDVVDIIVSGIGSLPALQWSFIEPVTLRDPNICADAASTVIKALQNLHASKKPLLLAVSTTGISTPDKPRDIPLAYTWLYKWLLHIPHVDKAKMEQTFFEAAKAAGAGSLRGVIAVKPTLLMDGSSLGLDSIRAGTEDEPAVGYTIRRQDVGEWMYANLIAKEAPHAWLGKGISLTT